MFTRSIIALSALFVATAAGLPANAEPHGHHHTTEKSSAKKSGRHHCAATAIKMYEKSMHKMHKGMDIAYSGDADYDFVAGMIPHHQGAVDMALIVLKYGKSPEMKELAERIIIAQRQEIGFMKNWLRARKSDYRRADADSRPSTIEYKKAMDVMHEGMMVGYTGDVDVDFALGMIPHHQGAVDMADILTEHGKALELRPLARDIIRSQKQEIALMKEWLATQKYDAPKPVKKQKTSKKKATNDHHAHH